MAEQCGDAAAQGCARAQQDEQEESEHSGRENQRKCGERLKNSQPAAAAQHQPRCQRHGYGQQDGSRDRCQLEREREGLPIHLFTVNE